VKWEGDRIELAYPEDSFEFRRAHDPKKREAFEAVCSEILGRSLVVVVRTYHPGEELSPAVSQLSVMRAKQIQEQQQFALMALEEERQRAEQASADALNCESQNHNTYLQESKNEDVALEVERRRALAAAEKALENGNYEDCRREEKCAARASMYQKLKSGHLLTAEEAIEEAEILKEEEQAKDLEMVKKWVALLHRVNHIHGFVFSSAWATVWDWKLDDEYAICVEIGYDVDSSPSTNRRLIDAMNPRYFWPFTRECNKALSSAFELTVRKISRDDKERFKRLTAIQREVERKIYNRQDMYREYLKACKEDGVEPGQ